MTIAHCRKTGASDILSGILNYYGSDSSTVVIVLWFKEQLYYLIYLTLISSIDHYKLCNIKYDKKYTAI